MIVVAIFLVRRDHENLSGLGGGGWCSSGVGLKKGKVEEILRS